MADGGWWTADGGRRTADGGRRTEVSAVVDIAAARPLSSVVVDVFDSGGTPSSSGRGCRCRGLVVSLPPMLSCGGAPPDPDGLTMTTTATMTSTTTGTTTRTTMMTTTKTTTPATDQSPPVAEGALSIVGLP